MGLLKLIQEAEAKKLRQQKAIAKKYSKSPTFRKAPSIKRINESTLK